MLISPRAADFIVGEEVTSEAYYRAHYTRPEWPGGASGITVGIGYDLGYATRERIADDWRNRLPPEVIAAMQNVAGRTGAAALSSLSWARKYILVPWDSARAEFDEIEIPRWEAAVAAALPHFDALPADCKGALVSLAYNRGCSFAKAGERYREMRAIRAAMQAQNFAAIPAELRTMKRLWASTSLRGLVRRREREAQMFEQGLQGAKA